MLLSAHYTPCYSPSGGCSCSITPKCEKHGVVCVRRSRNFRERFGFTKVSSGISLCRPKSKFASFLRLHKSPTSSQSLLDGNNNCGMVILLRHVGVRCAEGPIGDLDKKHMPENLAQMDEFALEARLQVAVESENYVVAAQLRDQLRVLQEDSEAGLRAANAKFYKAFESSDLKGMRDIWARGDNVHCIHPGAGRISGYDMVVASWELMLGPDVSLPLKIELHNLEVQVKGNMGYVTCLEVVRTSGSSWGKQLATNIFEKQNGSWFLCMHHASHITI